VENVNRFNLEAATLEMAKYIKDVLGPQHQGQKGMIHATYQQAAFLREHLSSDPRYMFHERHNRSSVYRDFRDSPSDSGRVLIASGMYEGVDLPEDAGRWQVITKIPWPSLGNPAIKYLSEKDPEWYQWECWKQVIQACGRICRTPEDYGVTYILDGSIQRLLKDGSHLLPPWFQDGLGAGELYLE
jgi:Rad3-related DNA helicase